MFKKIVIIGLGLMGGSLAAACRQKFPASRVIGITRNKKALTLARRKGWIQDSTGNIEKGAQGADLIVICTPVDTYLPILKKIDKVVQSCALVMDVGSVKGSVHRIVNSRKWKRISFVGVHPMVGSHERGIEAACPDLYKQGLVLLTRDQKTCAQSFKQAKKFWNKLAGKVVTLAPAYHDRLVGEISHLPHALAVCLVRTVSKKALPFVAKGFSDTTRIAASASSVWMPILAANKRNILASLSRFERELKGFKKILRSPDPHLLIRYLNAASKIRKSI